MLTEEQHPYDPAWLRQQHAAGQVFDRQQVIELLLAYQALEAKHSQATHALVCAAARILSPDVLRALDSLEEQSGRTLGRRALSRAIAKAEENLKLLAISVRQLADALR